MGDEGLTHDMHLCTTSQVTILDDERVSTTLINHINCTAVVAAIPYPAGEIANVSIISKTYFGNIVKAYNGDQFVIQIREKVSR